MSSPKFCFGSSTTPWSNSSSFKFTAPAFSDNLTKRSISPIKNASTAETPSTVINLKIMVEKKNNRVVFAESGTDFIDLLFSFLTLPIGTILRLLAQKTPPCVIGSINSLITSVDNLDARFLTSEACKEMLLHPRISSQSQLQCSNKNLAIEDYLDQRYCKYFYFCQNDDCRKDGDPGLSIYPNVRCKCGQVMDQLATLSEPVIGRASSVSDHDQGDGVFVKNRGEMFLITDDLQVVPGSTSSTITLLKKLGIDNTNELETQNRNLGPDEILQLLRLSLVSNTPFTHWISLKEGEGVSDLEKSKILEKITQPPSNTSPTDNSNKIRLTLIKSISENTVLYAESQEDFINFLFSFLTFPLGTTIKLLGGNSSLGCIDNIYQSVKELGTNNYLQSEEHKNMLLAPKLAPFCAWEKSMLRIDENLYPQYSLSNTLQWRVTPLSSKPNCYSVGKMFSVVNPKYPPGGTPCNGGFVRGPAKFMVTDSLVVTQLSPISSISFLAKLNVPISDVDEVVVEVGEEEALNILKAALISGRALTDVFNKA